MFPTRRFAARGILVITFIAFHSVSVPAAERELKEFLGWPALAALDLYQAGVSPVKGTRCPMFPSDSAYCREAFRRHGVVRGMMMTFDRLHRCGHDLRLYPVLLTAQGLRFQDPVPIENLNP